MAIQLSLYSNDSSASEYTDLDSNGRIDLYSADSYSTNTTQNDTSTLQVMFHYGVQGSDGAYEYYADLTPWVTVESHQAPIPTSYGLSTAPITGGVSATYLYAEDYQGNQISSLSDFSRVHNVYYSIETEQVDSMETTISVDFSSNTATFGTGTLYTFQGTDASGGTSGYWTDSDTQLEGYRGTTNPYDYNSDGSMGEGYYDSTAGLGSYFGTEYISWKQAVGDSGPGWYSESYPISEWLGSDSISPQMVSDGAQGSGYYEHKAGSGSYFGEYSSSFRYAEMGGDGEGWYLYDNVGSFGSGSYSDDGTYEFLGSDSGYQIYGSVGYYDSVIGSGSFLGDSPEYYSDGYYGSGWYASGSMGSGSFGSYYSGSSGETLFYGSSSWYGSGYYTEAAGSGWLGSEAPSFFQGSGSWGGSYGYWTDSFEYGSGSYAGAGSEYPTTQYASTGPDGAGYYSEEYGSGEFLGGSWPTIINDSSGSMGSVGYYLKTGEQGDGYYAGDGSMYPYHNNADSGSMGAGYYSSTYGSGDYHGSQGLPWGSGSMGYAYYDTQAEFGSGDYSATADYMYAGYGGEGYYSETTLLYGSASLQIERTSQAEIDAANAGGNTMANTTPLNYYITTSLDTGAPKYYTDGLGDNNGARGDAVDSLSFALNDTLYLGGVDDFYYLDSYNGGFGTREVDSHDLFTTWYDGQDNVIPGTGPAPYNKPVIVTQEMVDHGFYVTAIYESGMSFYYDTGLTQPAEDPSFGNINLGAGGSGQEAIMPSGETVGSTGGTGSDSQGDYDYGPLNALLISGENTLSTNPSDGHVDYETEDMYIPSYDSRVLREEYSVYLYDDSGTLHDIVSLDGSENTFVLDAGTDIDYFGYGYLEGYTDDSEVVVIQGAVSTDPADIRTVQLYEAPSGIEDWDVISFDGLSAGVDINLGSGHSVDAMVRVAGSATTDVVVTVDGAEGVFGGEHDDSIQGDGARNILHGGAGDDIVSGGDGQDLISGGAGLDTVYGGAGEDILIDLEGGDVIYGDALGAQGDDRENDDFVVGGNTTIKDFDLSPDGAGLSGRSNQANDIVFIQVAAASLAGAGFQLDEIYDLVTDTTKNGDWRDFVRDLQVDVVEGIDDAPNQINLHYIDSSGNSHNVGNAYFDESEQAEGAYNAVKMKDRIEDILGQFDSNDPGASYSDNAHILEQFFGMDSLTAADMAALERVVAAGEAADDGSASAENKTAVETAVNNALSSESQTSDAVRAVQDALIAQVPTAATGSAVVDIVEEVQADLVDVALAANEMETSLFVPIAVEEIRQGTVRTEVIEDRDLALAAIETARATAIAENKTDEQVAQAVADARQAELGKTTVVDRTPDTAPAAGDPASIVVLSNADDKVVSTSGEDDRFEVVPQVFVNGDGDEYDDEDLAEIGIDTADKTEAEVDTLVAETLQSFGQNVIVDLDDRGSDSSGSESGGGGDSSGSAYEVDQTKLGDVIYLEGVNDIGNVAFSRFQVGREGENSLKIEATVRSDDLSDGDNAIANAGEVTVFKQFDGLTDRFAVETLEISDTAGNSEYWSLSGAQADRGSDGAILNTYVTTDVSNTGKGILVGSDNADSFKVEAGYGGSDSVELLLTSFDANDTIDLSAFGEGLSHSVNAESGNVELTSGDEVKITLIGITDPSDLDNQLVLATTAA